MNAFCKLILVILVSFVEIRVRAQLLEEPVGCLQARRECALFVTSGVQKFNLQESEIRLAPGASVVVKAPDVLRVMKGEVLVRAKGSLTLQSLFTTAHVREGLVLLHAENEFIQLTNLTAETRYRPRGVGGDLDLPKGLMTEVGAVTSSGKARTSFPRSMSLKPLMTAWSKFFRKAELSTFKADFEQFLPGWRAGLDFVGPWYRETVFREVAEMKAEMERRRRLKEAREREEKYYREMFRRKNFLD